MKKADVNIIYKTKEEAEEVIKQNNKYQLSRWCPISKDKCTDVCASFIPAYETSGHQVLGGRCVCAYVVGNIEVWGSN